MKIQKWLLWFLLASPLGGWGVGCSPINKSTFRADSVRWVGSDSLALSRKLQASIGQSVRLRHFTFSAPDSAGRQYVESATLLTSATGETYAEEVAAEVKQTVTLTETHAIQSAEHTAAGIRPKRVPYWIVAALAAGIIVAVFVWKN
jgi:hypothetical protein